MRTYVGVETEQKAGVVPEPIWALFSTVKSHAPKGNRDAISRLPAP